jgi:hypothetical protein
MIEARHSTAAPGKIFAAVVDEDEPEEHNENSCGSVSSDSNKALGLYTENLVLRISTPSVTLHTASSSVASAPTDPKPKPRQTALLESGSGIPDWQGFFELPG